LVTGQAERVVDDGKEISMDVQIKSQNVRMTDHLRDYIESRVSKIERVHERTTDVKFELRSEHPRTGGEQFIAQFTIAMPGTILRSEVRNHDQHAAVDQAVDKMTRQIRRYRDRKLGKSRRNAPSLADLAIDQAEIEASAQEIAEDAGGAVVRSKRFAIQPMDTDEAIEQLELLGHDFFVFYNPETSQTNVLYRRKDGDYGLIEPEIA
jgi:putative sigma-54 modulation protein